ncbi:MAG: hypothetical protein SP1CHLAM54_17280 [Chlamydiia bacterium]|nr:hypothetical protein [Chlamydiia bacterium]MCH9616616.1 hypothetical protein [Chlamydiia bacterium]MCH9629346.1 hypothetical protein [Chlamydiia bacterium]
MLESLKPILDIQELDIKMIRLMRIKKQRQGELGEIEALHTELKEQESAKKVEITEYDKQIQALEDKVLETKEKLKKLEDQQSNVKKVEEFNALTQEMTTHERQKIALEQEASNLFDKKTAEEEILVKIQESLKTSASSSTGLKDEIMNSINLVNDEGVVLLKERQELATKAEPTILSIYERLLRNKKDRVVVPIENRTCSGCHITLTIQHENLVRKGENIVFCEHCSRVHYWQESEAVESTTVATRQRRRRVTAKSS